MFCRMVKAKDNNKYDKEFKLMKEYAPEMLSRKIYESLHQSAQMLHHVLNNSTKDSILLSAGSYDDMPTEVLSNMGYDVIGVDPELNVDLHTYKESHKNTKFDVIFSTSVIEHTNNDKEFIKDICEMLKPGGLCFITCDFHPDYKKGDPLPNTCNRFYTEERLKMLTEIIETKDCKLTEDPSWAITKEDLDFQWEGIDYCFMGMSFRKNKK